MRSKTVHDVRIEEPSFAPKVWNLLFEDNGLYGKMRIFMNGKTE